MKKFGEDLVPSSDNSHELFPEAEEAEEPSIAKAGLMTSIWDSLIAKSVNLSETEFHRDPSQIPRPSSKPAKANRKKPDR